MNMGMDPNDDRRTLPVGLRRRLGAFALAAGAGLSSGAVQAQVDARMVNESIEAGVNYLKRQQAPHGTWKEYSDVQPGGVTSLCTLALLSCGVPPDDEAVAKALRQLRAVEPTKTYAASLQTMVFCMATPTRDRALIARNANWLVAKQVAQGSVRGGWGYPSDNADNSNSQYALLALHEAERVGVQVEDGAWKAALDYWLKMQNADGSWGYHEKTGGSGSMTCAGISSVIIASSRLHEADAKVQGNQVLCCGSQDRNLALEKGLDWLGRNFSVRHNPGGTGWVLYYLYGMERAGRMSAERFLGGHDWYREGADMLVRSQDNVSGFFAGVGFVEKDPDIATSFALLFLSKGRRPVVMAKLRHGGDDWRHHRNDAANLTSYTETKWKRELAWQVIDAASATADDYLEAPVLFISGKKRPNFAPEQVQALRQYIDRGGFIFAEACCEGGEFDAGFRDLMKQMFPEPGHELRLLPRDHPIWVAEEPVDPDYMPPLHGLDVGCRTSVVYCPENLGCYWELAQPGRAKPLPAEVRVKVQATNAIGVNVLAYATNREVKYKLENLPEKDRQRQDDPLERAKLRIAKLRHPGGWDAAPAALINLQRALSDELGMRVDTDKHELTLTDKSLFQYHLLFVHGRNEFSLSPAERSQFKTFVERGGMVMIDAVCGSEAFARAVRRELAAIFPQNPLERIPATHALLQTDFSGFDIRKVRRRDPAPAGAKGGLSAQIVDVEPALEGVLLDERYGVVFSPFDLSCALEKHESLECRGYVREDAAKIAINLVLYSLH